MASRGELDGELFRVTAAHQAAMAEVEVASLRLHVEVFHTGGRGGKLEFPLTRNYDFIFAKVEH